MGLAAGGYNTWGEYFHDVGQVSLGYGDAISGTVDGIANLVQHPVQSAEGFAYAATHPKEVYNHLGNTIDELSQTNRGMGRMIGEVLITVGTYGATRATSVAGNSNKMVEVTRWGRAGLQSGDWVMKGGRTKLNYRLSGKFQKEFGNKYAPFEGGKTYNVPAGSLSRPRGLNPIDGRVKSLIPGQMRYNPGGVGMIAAGEATLFTAARFGWDGYTNWGSDGFTYDGQPCANPYK
jgi:hypothetical protein